VRSALGTLPWVEQESIQTIIETREVRFDLKDKSKFNEEEIKQALKEKKFSKMTVKSAPK
jgi:hypothetical protein